MRTIKKLIEKFYTDYFEKFTEVRGNPTPQSPGFDLIGMEGRKRRKILWIQETS